MSLGTLLMLMLCLVQCDLNLYQFSGHRDVVGLNKNKINTFVLKVCFIKENKFCLLISQYTKIGLRICNGEAGYKQYMTLQIVTPFKILQTPPHTMARETIWSTIIHGQELQLQEEHTARTRTCYENFFCLSMSGGKIRTAQVVVLQQLTLRKRIFFIYLLENKRHSNIWWKNWAVLQKTCTERYLLAPLPTAWHATASATTGTCARFPARDHSSFYQMVIENNICASQVSIWFSGAVMQWSTLIYFRQITRDCGIENLAQQELHHQVSWSKCVGMMAINVWHYIHTRCADSIPHFISLRVKRLAGHCPRECLLLLGCYNN